MFVLDSHCDTPTMMMRGRDIGIDNDRGHVDLPKLKAGGRCLLLRLVHLRGHGAGRRDPLCDGDDQ